jgi:hypothetical protein
VTTGVDVISVFAFLVYPTRPTGNSLTQTQLKSLSGASDVEVEIQVNNQFSSPRIINGRARLFTVDSPS